MLDVSAVKSSRAMSNEEIKNAIRENNVKFVRLQFVDINGQVKNMAIPAEQIDKILNNEIMLDGSSIKGFRNIIAHQYFGIDAEEVWGIILNELPILRVELEKII